MEKCEHKGYFATPPGTCFVKTDIPYANGIHPVEGNRHPFVVITDGPDYVECVMVTTLRSERKDRTDFLMRLDDAVEIRNTHPPLDPPEKHSSFFRASQTYLIPKEELYKDEALLICCDGGDTLDRGEVEAIRETAYLFGTSKDALCCDPYNLEEYETHMEDWLPAKDAVAEETENPIIARDKELREFFSTEPERPEADARNAGGQERDVPENGEGTDAQDFNDR